MKAVSEYLSSPNIRIALGTVVILLIVGLFVGGYIFFSSKPEVVVGDPVNIVLDFYSPWLEEVQATSTNPYQSELAKAPILSKALRLRLANTEPGELDPILCQTTVPSGISVRLVHERSDTAQVLVMSSKRESLEQAIVTLTKHNGGWYIDEVVCSPGEFLPDREFSFQTEGQLTKKVQSPLDSQYWHLVFEENNEPGHIVPLFFSAESVCINLDGQESACSPEQFKEQSKALVSGEMTELGVQVKKLELKK